MVNCMFPSTQKLPVEFTLPENISILLVSPYADDYSSLKSTLNVNKIIRCSGASEALQQITSERIELIICERDLTDGNWKTILAASEAMEPAPLVLVVSQHADESLWAEVLNLGGYDVLLKPFDRHEINRVIAMAWRFWLGKRSRQTTPHVAQRQPSIHQYA
jgi:DNA-binding NtrC family response regulator